MGFMLFAPTSPHMRKGGWRPSQGSEAGQLISRPVTNRSLVHLPPHPPFPPFRISRLHSTLPASACASHHQLLTIRVRSTCHLPNPHGEMSLSHVIWMSMRTDRGGLEGEVPVTKSSVEQVTITVLACIHVIPADSLSHVV